MLMAYSTQWSNLENYFQILKIRLEGVKTSSLDQNMPKLGHKYVVLKVQSWK